ncbi:hypothetical protein [Quadrisphaera sp. INWT6]|uniref:hypothetical protein n=1 Tax=Quadrisphaera sp. INWT6 TaxID=2596917 RepID=UPI001892119D|nr:hypothetical protein [Quadrisphaera sp. INWT6]MBF5081484.1 hypothetical protein [Quadrisphaera sp. INWT6]
MSPGGHGRRAQRTPHPSAAGPVVAFWCRWALALAAVQLLLLGGLVAAQAVPNPPVVAALAAAVADGGYGPDYRSDRVGGRADGFTECVVLGYGVSSADDTRSLWFRATGGPRLESCQEGAVQVRALAAGASVVPPATYFRYWNGYSVITRPVLATLGVPGLRLVSGLLLALGGLALWQAARRRLGAPAALALVVPVAGATNALTTPALAFTHALSLAAVAAGVALTAVATGHRHLAGWRGAALGAGAAGALFAYVDLLTTPAMSWALCTAVAGAVAWRSTHGRHPAAASAARRSLVRALLAAGAAWPVAFGGTWVCRWVVAAAVQGPGVLTAVADKSAERLDGAGAAVDPAFGAPTSANVTYWWSTTATALPLLVVAAVAVVVALVLAVRRGGAPRLVVAALLAAPALLVPAWYEVLSNHSQVHAFFTYRSVPAAVGVVVAACAVACSAGAGERG